MRRSFRRGLWLGLLAGLLVAIVKVVQTRREQSGPEVAEWPPFQPSPPSPAPEVQPSRTVDSIATEAAPAPSQARAPAKAPAKVPAKKAAKKVVKAQAAKQAAKGVGKRAGKKVAKRAAKATKRSAPGMAWVEPDDGVCPSSHPIKAKLSSGLFHLPGMAFYNRTRADRCYADEDSAVQDGLTRAKR